MITALLESQKLSWDSHGRRRKEGIQPPVLGKKIKK
jgi:hypothetical protein